MSSDSGGRWAAALARNTPAFETAPRARGSWARRLGAALARYTDADLAAGRPTQQAEPPTTSGLEGPGNAPPSTAAPTEGTPGGNLATQPGDPDALDAGRVDEAIAVLRARVAAGDEYATLIVAELLNDAGRVNQAIATSRARVEARDEDAAYEAAAAHWLPAKTRYETLFRGRDNTVTTEFLESGGFRFPIADLENIERWEHGGLIQSSFYELWAWFRGQRIRIVHSYDPREFGEICRALTRARELADAEPSSLEPEAHADP